MNEKKNKTSVTFEHGHRYMELDEFQNAINEFDKTILINPDYYYSWYCRGYLNILQVNMKMRQNY